MSLVQINWKPGPRQLRVFGLVLLGACILLAGFFFWKGKLRLTEFFLWLGCLGGLPALTGTKAALPFYWAWMGLAYVMGQVSSRVLLTFFYYGVISSMGMAMRLSGRDALRLKRKKLASYWNDLPKEEGTTDYQKSY